MLNLGPGLAFELMMSQILLVRPPLPFRFSMSTETVLLVEQMNVKRPSSVHVVLHSEAKTFQARSKTGNTFL